MKTILESALPPSKHIANVEPRSSKDDALFTELAAVLKKHDAIDRFGVCLLHRHFDIAPGECLLEETDVQTRIQTIKPIAGDKLTGEKYTETAWRLGDGFIATNLVCLDYGNGHQDFPRPSDRRLKRDIQPLTDVLSQMQRLRPVSYEYRQDVGVSLPTSKQFGFIAQDVERVFPACVSEDAAGFKRVDYVSLVPMLVAALQEQQQQIESLQTELAALRSEIPSTGLSCV